MPEQPYVGDVEIRVHGVSGTPPEDLLGRQDVRLAAGDRVSGFYRPTLLTQMRDVAPADARPARVGDDSATVDGPADPPQGPWLEGYSWGGWTSGAKTRALWLALLPFALVNVATRMLPPDASGLTFTRSCRLVATAVIRVLALSMTLTLVYGVANVSMVTVALRCGTVGGAQGACYGLPAGLTDFLGGLRPEFSVLVCAVVPVVVLLLLWVASRQVSKRYEDKPGAADVLGRADDEPMPLLRADLWRSGPVIRRLRLLHNQAGLASIVVLAAWVLPGGTSRTVTLLLGVVTLAAVVVLVCVRAGLTGAAERRLLWLARLTWVPLVAAAVTVLLHVAGGSAGTGLDADAAVRAADMLWLWTFMVQGGLLGLVLVLIGIMRLAGSGHGPRMFVHGYAGLVIAMLGWLIGTVLTDAVLVLGPTWLARPGFAATPWEIATALDDPATAGWFGNTTRSAGVGALVGVAALVILLLYLGVRALIVTLVTSGSVSDHRAVASCYGKPDPRSARAKAISRMFWWARRVDKVPRGMGVLCAVIAALLLVQLVARPWREDAQGWAGIVLGRVTQGCRLDTATMLCTHASLMAWGVFLTAVLAVGIVAMGVFAYRTPAMRRGVGVLWDLACFWPRDAHPFAPPCYNERTMPQVSERVAWYLGKDGSAGSADAVGDVAGDEGDRDDGGDGDDGALRGRVLLAGHSQGTVIALAAVMIQPAEVCERLSLVTAGCVLDRLYSRFFPRYFGPKVYDEAVKRLGGRWINIWRYSDYLGGSVPYPPLGEGSAQEGPVTGPRNVRSVDPAFGSPDGDSVLPRARRHSDYWDDAAFLPAVRALVGESRGAGLSVTPPGAP